MIFLQLKKRYASNTNKLTVQKKKTTKWVKTDGENAWQNYHPLNNSSEKKTFSSKLGNKRET